MTAFPLHTVDTAPEDSKAVLRATTQAYGFLPNLHATMAESPVALRGLDQLFALIGGGSLTPQEQQLTMLTVSVLNACEYCVAGHSFVGRSVQLDEAVVQALRWGERITGKPRLQALQSFVEAAVNERGRVPGAVLAAFLEAGYTHRQSLEVVAIIAAKTLSNYANNLAGTPPDAFMADPAVRWVAPARSA